MQWVYFDDAGQAVSLTEYRRHADKYKSRRVAFVLDTNTGERTPGKPPEPEKKPKKEDAD
jgi:hypothetical protein